MKDKLLKDPVVYKNEELLKNRMFWVSGEARLLQEGKGSGSLWDAVWIESHQYDSTRSSCVRSHHFVYINYFRICTKQLSL